MIVVPIPRRSGEKPAWLRYSTIVSPPKTLLAQHLEVGDLLINPRRVVVGICEGDDGRIVVTSRVPIEGGTREWTQRWLPSTPVLIADPR